MVIVACLVCCLLAADCCLLVADCCFAACSVLLVACCLLLGISCCLRFPVSAVCLFGAGWLLFVLWCSVFAIRGVMIVVCWSLFVGSCVLVVV